MRLVILISAISSDNTGSGGHYHSAKVLAESLSKAGHDVVLCCLGDIFPGAYSNLDIQVKHIAFNGSNYLYYFRAIFKFFKGYSPDCIHSFDNKSYFVARLASLFYGYGLLLTKPGGPNPKSFFPHARDLVVFSDENFQFFQSKNKFKHSRVHLIPNRLSSFSVDSERILSIRESEGVPAESILRIGRICHAYREVILQTIKLVNDLNDQGVNVKGVIVGVIQDQDVYDEIMLKKSKNIILLTEKKYTDNAAGLIELSDFIVGTGRGFMEAASKGRVLLTTQAGAKHPVLVNEENFAVFMATNFSPRNNYPELDEKNNFNLIKALLEGSEALKEYQSMSSCFSKSFFEIDAAIEEYGEVYKSSVNQKFMHGIDLMLNLVTFIRFYLPVTLKKIRFWT